MEHADPARTNVMIEETSVNYFGLPKKVYFYLRTYRLLGLVDAFWIDSCCYAPHAGNVVNGSS